MAEKRLRVAVAFGLVLALGMATSLAADTCYAYSNSAPTYIQGYWVCAGGAPTTCTECVGSNGGSCVTTWYHCGPRRPTP